MTTDDLPESEESLVTLVAPAIVWMAHFVLSYGTVAIYCAKLAGPDGALGPARIAIGVYTAVALAVVAFFGVRGYRRAGAGASKRAPHDDDSPLARHRFLGFSTLLLAGLSALAIVYSGLAVVFMETCR
jgi:hypothetical protein